MEKRYQVFVSSTYDDLKAERQEVMQALLELDCMPAGMELFPAANEDQWSLIKRVIDECDYYIVIVGGRYGSIGPKGLSYTQMEFEYAQQQRKPTIAFLHKSPTDILAGKVEQTDAGREKLNEFRIVLEKRVCKYWTSPADLGSVVSRSLVQLIKVNPSVGWIRADQALEALAAPEVLRLRRTIEELEQKLEEARLSGPSGSADLAQGTDTFDLRYTFDANKGADVWDFDERLTLSWDEIFSYLGPEMINEAKDERLLALLFKRTQDDLAFKQENSKDMEGFSRFRELALNREDYQTIKVQLRALGLITKSQKPRSVKDIETYWTLTPYGDQRLTTLRAIRKATDSLEAT